MQRAPGVIGTRATDAAPVGPPERRDAAEHRSRILAAARELFAREGVDAVSMRQVRRAAGVGQGTLYRRYAHKGELCAALLAESIRAFKEETHAELVAEPPLPALALLDALLGRIVLFNEANAPLLGAVEDAAAGRHRDSWYGGPFYGWLRQVTATMLRRGLERGELRRPLDVEWVADALLAPLAIDLYLFQRRELGYEPERIRLAARGLLDGLRTPPASGAADR